MYIGTTRYRSGANFAQTSLKRYKYVFKELDNETGLYNYGMRYYAPHIARFVSVDPLQFDYPDLTSFQYTSNRPISGIDLDGKEFEGFNLNNIKSPLQVEQDKWEEIGKETIPAMKAVYETTIVLDMSWSATAGKYIGFNATFGISATLSLNAHKVGLYPHVGTGITLGTNTNWIDFNPVPSLAIGIVGGEFNEASGYYGGFYDYSIEINGLGTAYCYWPDGSDAMSISINPKTFAEAILAQKYSASYTERVDFYFMIPLLEPTDPENYTLKKQMSDFGKTSLDPETYLNKPSILNEYTNFHIWFELETKQD